MHIVIHFPFKFAATCLSLYTNVALFELEMVWHKEKSHFNTVAKLANETHLNPFIPTLYDAAIWNATIRLTTIYKNDTRM